jgi:hypothetical protein
MVETFCETDIYGSARARIAAIDRLAEISTVADTHAATALKAWPVRVRARCALGRFPLNPATR